MNKIHLNRDGQTIGQFSPDELRNLYLAQKTSAGDYVWYEGVAEWIPLEQFMRERMGVQAPTTPPRPALKVAGAAVVPPIISTSNPPPLPANAQLAELGELEQSVLNGGRFVIYPYCISIIVLTFRRASNVVFLKPGEDGFGNVLGYSAASMVLGWWGFPWGPIFTIQTLFSTMAGGKDVTGDVLTAKLGPARASALLARRGPVKSSTRLRVLQFGVPGSILVLVALFSTLLGASSGREARTKSANRPASASSARPAISDAFTDADRSINLFKGQASFGNNDKARQLADFYNGVLQTSLGDVVQSSKRTFSASKGNFMTHCELHDDSCVFMVHVPDLRHFDAESKVLLGDMAYVNALGTLKSQGITNEVKVAVGVRGALLYDRVLEGKYLGTFDKDHLGDKPQVSTTHARETLANYFVSAKN